MDAFAWGSIVLDGPLNVGSEFERRLSVGAAIACRLRGAIRDQLGGALGIFPCQPEVNVDLLLLARGPSCCRRKCNYFIQGWDRCWRANACQYSRHVMQALPARRASPLTSCWPRWRAPSTSPTSRQSSRPGVAMSLQCRFWISDSDLPRQKCRMLTVQKRPWTSNFPCKAIQNQERTLTALSTHMWCLVQQGGGGADVGPAPEEAAQFWRQAGRRAGGHGLHHRRPGAA